MRIGNAMDRIKHIVEYGLIREAADDDELNGPVDDQ